MQQRVVPSANHLLVNLPLEDQARLLPYIQSVRLSLGDVVGDTRGDFGFAYFPTTCVVAITCNMENGASVEVALIGNDGVLGTSLFLGGEVGTSRAIVGVAGEALRMDARCMRSQFTHGGPFQKGLLRYTDALITQLAVTAACNGIHTLEKRFCRWLLLMHDRVPGDELIMTQEFIAGMLGGRRETVTVAAGRLQDAGLIHYTRGRLRIRDRRRLEANACECYGALSMAIGKGDRTRETGITTLLARSHPEQSGNQSP